MNIPGHFVAPLNETMGKWGIVSPRSRAAFLATCNHETGGFKWLHELWGKTPTKWQAKYQGRHGNVHPGDGKKYRGRGLIHVTFYDNYVEVTKWVREFYPDCPDFAKEPEKLEEVLWACASACAWWSHHNLNAIADTGDIRKVRRVVNGPGMLGLAEVTKDYNSLLA